MSSGGVHRPVLVMMVLVVAAACGGGQVGGEATSEPASSIDTESSTTTSIDGEVDGDGDGDMDGDGASPESTMAPPAPGSLRTPLPFERATTIPDSFWAIDDARFDLVRVDADTGNVIETLGGWGAELAQGEGAQVLTSVEVAPGGRLWLDDCCEPAFGSVFDVDDDQRFDLRADSGAVGRRTGLSPEVSPDGALVAVAVGSDGVSVTTTGSGAAVAEGSAIASVVADAIGADPDAIGFPYPLAWLSAEVLVVVSPGADEATLQAVDVSGATPVAVGPAVVLDGNVVAGDVRTDGHLVIALSEAGADASAPVAGRVLDPDTGEVVAAFALPDGTSGIDYDTTGTYLLTVNQAGVVTWLGRGQSAQLATGMVAASW
ncbi:MAG: hypothetical protein AAFN30_04280 [Actinomycetota bacterium]